MASQNDPEPVGRPTRGSADQSRVLPTKDRLDRRWTGLDGNDIYVPGSPGRAPSGNRHGGWGGTHWVSSQVRPADHNICAMMA